MKAQVYKDPRPAEHFTRFHERVRSGKPDFMYELVKLLLTPILLLFYRTRCIDSDKVPVEGPAVITPNHFSFFDHFFIAVYLRRKVQFMAKSQLFQRPIQFIFTHGGVFPVLRGRRDEEAFKTAHTILARGDLVVMYAEGGRSRTGELGQARPGVGRIALESGVPVVPTAISGSAEGRNWRKLRFPKVTARTATRTPTTACTVMARTATITSWGCGRLTRRRPTFGRRPRRRQVSCAERPVPRGSRGGGRFDEVRSTAAAPRRRSDRRPPVPARVWATPPARS